MTDFDLLTPFGMGADTCWKGLSDGICRLAPIDRFNTSAFLSHLGGAIPGLTYRQGPSLVLQMLEQLAARRQAPIPSDAHLLLATTTGEIDFLEADILRGATPGRESLTRGLLTKTREIFGLKRGGQVVSSACTSSSAAIALAAADINAGRHDCVLVVACDGLTEFVFTGFNSLMALSPDGARPFDKDRNGLSVGEAAGYLVLMSEDRCRREHRTAHAEVAGYGLSNDANHMTGPSRDGGGLAHAIGTALRSAGLAAGEIDFISAHGTGTLYNDAMEMMAFHTIFGGPRPLFSIKGAIGHSMGAAGLIETILSAMALQQGTIPGTTGLVTADPLASGWVSASPTPCGNTAALTTNSGFGGVNAALVLTPVETPS